MACAMPAMLGSAPGRRSTRKRPRAVLERNNSSVRERTVVIIPRQQKLLESGEGINTRILLDGIDKDSDRAQLVLEVTAIRFDES